jgi:hypothetical protein
MCTIKSYFKTVLCEVYYVAIRFDHSLKLGVKIGIRKWCISKIVNSSLTVRLIVMVTINH